MIYIDTTDDELKYNLDNLQYNLRRNHEDIPFNEDEFALVRSCDYLPDKGVCHPICNIPFLVKTNTPARDAIFQILKEKYNINAYEDSEKYKMFINEVDKYSPYSTQYRSTVHFSLNGIVTDHSKGSWSNQNFVIIDRLNAHLSDNVESLRFEDTFIQDDVTLSNDAIILVDQLKYDALKEKYPDLDNYNVVVYKGDRKQAVDYVLANMGIISVEIKEHSMNTEDRLYPSLENSLDNIRNKYNIDSEKHIYSKSYKEDDEKNLILWKMYYEDFYNKLFAYFNINDSELYDYLLNSTDIFGKSDKMEEIIKNIGLDRYCEFINKYNYELLQAKENGILKTNNDILNAGELTIESGYKR